MLDDPKRAPNLTVLWLIKGLGPGGAERLLVSLAAAHAAETSVEVGYAVGAKDALVPDLERRGVTVHHLGDRRWPLALALLLRSRRYDVIHCHSPLLAAAARLVVRTMRRRPLLVTTEHNRWETYRGPTNLVNRLTARLTDVTLAVSQDARDGITDKWVRDRTDVLVHGVELASVRADTQAGSAVRAELGIGEDEVVIVTVANYRRQKDHPNLLMAAAEVLIARQAVRFVVVGQGPLRDEIHALHERLGLGDRYLLLGHREDPTRVLAAADVFTLASLWEGYPVALMEALALGLPVVATAVGGVPDAVRDGIEGLLVPSGDSEALAAALLRLVDDVDLRTGLGAGATKRGDLFDISRTARRLEDIYRRRAKD